MFYNPEEWTEIDPKDAIEHYGEKVILKAEQPTKLYFNEAFVGTINGDEELHIPAAGTIKFATKGRMWFKTVGRAQTRSQSDEKFTTLDRPAPLSPEMVAIQRLQRKNEIDRENMRLAMERKIDEIRERSAAGDEYPVVESTSPGPDDSEDGRSEEHAGGAPDTEKQTSGGDNESADPAVDAARADTRRPSGADGDKRRRRPAAANTVRKKGEPST